ncbi:hypothetical protein O1L60_45360 [Streptomyces diastatochromogenes]|nr:hypothetical protein [Streptomyces diastatochromogenes]
MSLADQEHVDVVIHRPLGTDAVHAETRTGAAEDLHSTLEALGLPRHSTDLHVWQPHPGDDVEAVMARAAAELDADEYDVRTDPHLMP